MAIRRVNSRKKLFPVQLTECQRGFLSYVSTSTGLPMTQRLPGKFAGWSGNLGPTHAA